MKRFIPMKRIDLEGKVWWVVYDTVEHHYSTYTCFGKYRPKRDCQYYIDYYTKAWDLPE